jgi:hypothetical protein
VARSKSIDWAHLDCAACHHDLKADSWRQKRGYGDGKPGHLVMRYWSPELVKLAIEALPEKEAKEKAAEFKKLLKAMSDAFKDRATGDPDAASKAAKDLGKFADGLAKALNERKEPIKADDTKKLLGRFPKLFFDKGRLMDFDSTRQVVWAYEVMHDEVVDPDGKNKKSRFQTRQVDLTKALLLRLASKEEGKYDEHLSKLMKARGDYDPTKEEAKTPLLKLGWPLGK